MMSTDYVLELSNVFHTGQVEPGTVLQRLLGSVKTGVILKDVSLEVHGGEVMAILGSKGSGKRSLLEVIARRAQGPTRGQVLLNGVPMSLRLFQESCGYVSPKCDFIPGLSVQQTLQFSAALTVGLKVSGYVRRSRVKQVLADLALTQVASRTVETLTFSEHRRLCIGMQLVKDPVVLLLDEPTWELDPLNTYFVVSILSNHAKKYNRIVVLTMERPRSDIFPFLDRVAYLCLGDVVYSGSTRMMLDYFRGIGFPCPELENPLMYYLCLSTVDRRSRDRFIESTHQIAALVEKFKLEGGPFRKFAAPPPEPDHASHHKLPLSAFGHPGAFRVFGSLFIRSLLSMFGLSRYALTTLFVKLFMLPVFFLLLWIFYEGMQQTSFEEQKYFQRTFVTRNGLVFNCLAGVYFIATGITAYAFAPHRTRFYQENREGLYSGPLFIFCQLLVSLPFSAATVAISASIVFGLTDLKGGLEWLAFAGTLWACYLFAEQQTISIMLVVRRAYIAAICSLYIAIITLMMSSGCLRSLNTLPDWLYCLSYATQPRFTGASLNEQLFKDRDWLVGLPHLGAGMSQTRPCSQQRGGFGCRYLNGTHYLAERYKTEDLDFPVNIGVSFAFPGIVLFFNILLYLIPLPAFVKAKFRE